MPTLSRQRQVALVLPVNVSWGAVLAQGVADYSREHESWDFTTSPPTMAEAEEVALTPYSLKGWVGQGAIAVINDAAEARAARRLGFPVVCVNGNVRNPGLPRVMPDYYAGGADGRRAPLGSRLATTRVFWLGGPLVLGGAQAGLYGPRQAGKSSLRSFRYASQYRPESFVAPAEARGSRLAEDAADADCHSGRPRLPGTGAHR